MLEEVQAGPEGIPSQKGQINIGMGHQEDGGVTIPGDVEEMTGCGTYCYGLVDMVVIDQELDLILEVLST